METTNGTERASRTGDGAPAATNSVALRSLGDPPVASSLGEVDQPQQSTSLSWLGQSFSQFSSNDEVEAETNRDRPYPVLELEEMLVRSLAQNLYLEPSAIDAEIPFVEMGLDSVLAVEWIQSINKNYGINLPASCVYDYPTIRQLASSLQKEGLKRQKTPVQSAASRSLDDVLQQVKLGTLDTKKAEELLNHFAL